MIIHQLERIKHSKLIDKVVVATSNDESDDILADVCYKNGIDVYRGSLDNVLDRFYQCAKQYTPSHVVRLTGDCPLSDWNIIDSVIKYHLDNNYDYTSNTLELTFPDGLDVEVMSMFALETAYNYASLSSELEHVTPYIYKNSDKFRLGCYKNNCDLSKLRLTVDEQEDFELISKIYGKLYPSSKLFVLKDIINFLNENKYLLDFNSNFERNEGYKKSLLQDKVVKEGN